MVPGAAAAIDDDLLGARVLQGGFAQRLEAFLLVLDDAARNFPAPGAK